VIGSLGSIPPVFCTGGGGERKKKMIVTNCPRTKTPVISFCSRPGEVTHVFDVYCLLGVSRKKVFGSGEGTSGLASAYCIKTIWIVGQFFMALIFLGYPSPSSIIVSITW